ncbi:hypothetical protein JNB88_14260 [Rhizobium cauense]|uniref:hypothetical protein n=1 Tax=Rhizobium cauense TaxID=1166683 RepID=UPI001C6F4ED1|nr:hypothetical protein [Rhizobium cauense]MBW9114804.1 hypothetical protein [Rhizobium cauense]
MSEVGATAPSASASVAQKVDESDAKIVSLSAAKSNCAFPDHYFPVSGAPFLFSGVRPWSIILEAHDGMAV